MSIIVRVFENEAQARSAAASLAEAGIAEKFIVVIAPSGEGQPDVATSIRAGKMLGEKADFAAAQLQHGRTVVAVDAPLGLGVTADRGLRAGGALDVVAPTQRRRAGALPGDVLSDFLGVPALTSRRTMLTGLWGPEIARSKLWFSEILGLPMLSSKPAPLSTLFGIKTLSPVKKPWTSSFGMSLLSKSPYIFGGTMLMKNPAPFSSLFGLRLLTRERWLY